MPFILDDVRAIEHEKTFTPKLNVDKCPVHKENATFQKLYPILARLPNDEAYDQDERFLDDYLKVLPESSIPGTLPFESKHENVRYTQSSLPVIDPASKDLWVALHDFHPLTASYAGNFQCRSAAHARTKSQGSCPMKQSSSSALDLVRRVFNWDELILPQETEGSFYGVVFRSKRAEGSSTEALMLADKQSHEEAVAAGGLLMYWYGVPDSQTGSNLATCIWRTRDEARKASTLPLHRQAAKLATQAYDDFELSRYKVVKRQGETGVRIEEWN